MNNIIKIIRQFLHPLTLALVILYFQLNYSYIPTFFNRDPIYSYPHFFVSSIFLGLNFGFIGCPVCSLPLSLTINLWGENIKKVIIPILLFNFSRFFSIFVYSFLGSEFFFFIRTFIPTRYTSLILGLIMIIMGMLVLRDRKYHFTSIYYRRRKIKFLYILWGIIMGLPCGFEATGFLAYLWSYHLYNILLKILSFLLFSFFAILPNVVVTLFLYWGIESITSLYLWLKPYIRNFSFFYLFFLGLIFIFRAF
ncbi:MAG: hypothetical protein NC822_02565 [Candidatus Omnitrophica bacterium]|nr:hypothetical protein [Candidatus Omnitrophota bacterium]MCM8826111.1 hypothetical protein [Candidatus Omnitrophota bacterium]